MSKNFSRINFHTETVDRFKKYAIENEVNYTETLEAMLDFFEKNYISPFKPFLLLIPDYCIFSIKEWMPWKYYCVKWKKKL